MCGICGIAYTDAGKSVDVDVLSRMCHSIRHRGPDEGGQHIAGAVGLGIRRLSIIDVEAGHQPVSNETSTVHAVCNGEIYNYRSMREELRRGGHRFRTHSDVEVIPHVYEEGAAFVSRLRGMFALALWDEQRRTMVLAVDRFGIKPLYYVANSRGLVFGSELKCLLAAGTVAGEVDPEGVAQYFTFGYIPAPHTVFRGIRKLPPGHLVHWTSDGGAILTRYWRPQPAALGSGQSPVETRRRLREALRESVRAHLVSDVPVGAFLSGGVDSSAVVALMSEVSPEPIKTFSIGFSDPRFSELSRARMVAERFGTDHHELVVEPADAALLPELVSHFDEPFADASALPTYYVSKLASESVKVALSGDGGDELFVGYTMFRGLELARLSQQLPRRLRNALTLLADAMPSIGNANFNDQLIRIRRRLADTLLAPKDAFHRKLASPGLPSVAPFLSSELRVLLAAPDPYAVIDSPLDCASVRRGGHPLDPYLLAGLAVTLPGDMLVKVDRMSMASSLEVRVPLLDHELVDHVASIPVEQRYTRWRLKALLRDTMADVLPADTVRQSKRGFTVPLAAWFRGNLMQFAREVLTGSAARKRGLLDVQAIDRLLRRHGAGEENVSSTIWSLLVFELWCSQYLDG